MEKNTSCFLKIEEATLAYPSAPYNILSLKAEILKILKLKQPTRLIYDIVALKDVSLEIKEGERVGIIGRNGAGKSTLLKAMAGLYPLQSGKIVTYGSIRGLFELNLGFEIEATGRENIGFRGLLLGETPKSIKDKEEEIIAFADIGEFIDYPIKTYSTGMLVRLAFAISTTISGDILLVDEIFGAGDAIFQTKARERMMNMINQAKILVFVSHALDQVQNLCHRVIWLDDGRIRMDGSTKNVINEFKISMGAL